MANPIIAIICDFDGTLGPDMISFLLEEYGIDPKMFWDKITSMVEEDGWDPAQAYLNEIVKYAKRNKIPDLTKTRLRRLGAKLQLFPGVPQVFPELKRFVKTNAKLKSLTAPIELRYYIISGGLEQMIRGTPVAKYAHAIFACDFHYNLNGTVEAVKRTISFTEKTKFIYAINKGIEQEITLQPYRVNDAMEMAERPIPFAQMIYIGDGPSDIPCMSMIKQNGGEGIGVSETGKFKKGYELARGKRLSVGPYSADYRPKSDMRQVLHEILTARGLDIDIELRKKLVEAPRH